MKTSNLFLAAGLVFCSISRSTAFAETVVLDSGKEILSQLALNDLQDKPHHLDEWYGKVIILNFWATWCGPCQIEIPHLIQYQSEYVDKGLRVVGIGLDEARKLNNYVRTVGINYQVLHADPQHYSHLLQDWGDTVGVLPYTVVINRSGQPVYRQAGIFSDEAFNVYVKPLLDTNHF
ncbi:MAG TPA: TlpA family protein disulfide reductase [Crenotrichaceae bacterium]|nr:TlpA family protein disulfide reductase [Crenotrichaceae bacterium]